MEKENEPKQPASETESAAIIQDLQAKLAQMASRNADLEKAKTEYYDKVLNGTNTPESEPQEKHRSPDEIRKELRGYLDRDETPTNLAYCKLIVELDNETKRNGEESVFLPKGHKIGQVKPEEEATAEHLNEVLADCIEKSGDDPDAFNILLAKRIQKDIPVRKK